MKTLERRAHSRMPSKFKIRLKLARISRELDGVTQNLSQGGAFITSPNWPICEKGDQAKIQISLPPEFTGQADTLTLTGLGLLKRIEEDLEGIAIQFSRELKTFEPSL